MVPPSFAFGLSDSTGQLLASGSPSFAFGQDVEATGNDAFAFGYNFINSTNNSLMIGFTTNTPTMTVTSTSVGIGTVNSSSQLTVNGGVAIGKACVSLAYISGNSAASGQLIVQGNVGIGTWTAAGGSLIVATGNVGIGTLTPGTKFDVFGTVRMTGLTMSGQTPSSGQVLTATDSSGDATWSSPGSVAGWTISGTNLYNTNSGNVGINTLNGCQRRYRHIHPAGCICRHQWQCRCGTRAPQDCSKSTILLLHRLWLPQLAM